MVWCHIFSNFFLISSSLSESNKDEKKKKDKSEPVHFLKTMCFLGGAFNLLFDSFHNNPWE